MSSGIPIASLRQGVAEILALPLIRLTVSNPRPGARWRRITGRTLEGKDGPYLQLEQFTGTQVFHENLPLSAAEERLALLLEDYGQLDATCRGAIFCLKISKKGKLFLQRQAAKTVAPKAGHNREKNYLLPEGVVVPPLVDQGVLTPAGQVVKAKYDKFKQINRFLEFLDDLLAGDDCDPVRIVDFGCGKSYLTFVVYHYITRVLHRRAEMVGLDLKEDVIEHCNQVAEKYGYEGLRFLCGDIKDYHSDRPPHMVITLHACDTATDLALYHAVRWGTKYILSVPCCQHEMNRSVKRNTLPPITEYGILKERFSALSTDALRAKLLESQGYEVQVMEFIDLAHSPKNLLIRARKSAPSEKKRRLARENAETLLRRLCGESTLHRLLYGQPLPVAAADVGRIRRAVPEELDEIMALYAVGRASMRAAGNDAQWTGDYPSRPMIEADIRVGNSFVYEVEGRLQAVFALIWGEDPSYAHIDGAWLSRRPYAAVHRMASRGELKGVADRCLRWAFDLCGALRADTHERNLPMRHVLEKNGFVYCGTILCDEGTPRRAYEKIQ